MQCLPPSWPAQSKCPKCWKKAEHFYFLFNIRNKSKQYPLRWSLDRQWSDRRCNLCQLDLQRRVHVRLPATHCRIACLEASDLPENVQKFRPSKAVLSVEQGPESIPLAKLNEEIEETSHFLNLSNWVPCWQRRSVDLEYSEYRFNKSLGAPARYSIPSRHLEPAAKSKHKLTQDTCGS